MDLRRTPRRLLAYLLAVPVIVLVYIGYALNRVWTAVRPGVATFLGATVISTVYADEALKRAPATPMRIAAVLALAIVLVGPGAAPAPASAAGNAADRVIAAARQYLGLPYRLGAEGPDRFDCSGLIYRAFKDAGELPRVGGMRLLARGYLRWFSSRGLFTKNENEARPGDLVVWDNGAHIGIYLGDGKTISAIVNPYGVKVHELDWINNQRVTQFLLVDWGRTGDGEPPPEDDDPGDGDGDGDSDDPEGSNGGDGDGPGVRPDDQRAANPGAGPGNGNSRGSRPDNSKPDTAASGQGNGGQHPPAPPETGVDRQGIATGTLNMRASADPSARIIGWVSRGQNFRIVGKGNSPSGWLWYQVRTPSGKEGWLFSYWVREL